MSDRYGDWAQRNRSRGGNGIQATAAAPMPGGVQVQAQALTPAPPGYAWLFQPGVGYVLVQLAALPSPVAAPPAPPQYQPHQQYAQAPQQSQAVPVSYLPPPQQFSPPAGAPDRAPPPQYPSAPPIQSCTLIRADGKDPYADLMANVPSLVAPTAYDASQGRPSPETVAAVAGTPEFQMAMGQNQTPFAARSMPVNQIQAIGSVPLPEVAAPPTAPPSSPAYQPPPMAAALDGPSVPVSTRPSAN